MIQVSQPSLGADELALYECVEGVGMIENPGDYTNIEADIFEITYTKVNDDTEHKIYAMTPAKELFTIGDVLKFARAWFDDIDDDIMIIGVKEINRGEDNFFTVIE